MKRQGLNRKAKITSETMKGKTICATLLLMAIGMQSTWAQKVLVYKADKSRIELNTSEVDSIVFISEGNDYEKPFNLEGKWYLSGRSGAADCSDVFADSISYSYNENVLYYQEYSFKRTQGETNNYIVSWREKYLLRREGESTEDYFWRMDNGQYTPDELIMPNWSEWEGYNWLLLGDEINTSMMSSDFDFTGLNPFAKIIQKSYNHFTIVAKYFDIIYLGEEAESYKYYFTFTRIE